jgi:anti-sigma regulatory factor (Ser/Thr protein kinase)
VPDGVAAAGLRHMVLFYRGMPEYRAALASFARTGLAGEEPILLAVPAARSVLPDWLGGRSGLVTTTDMTELGRNPARIIPALRAFADKHLGQRVRIISESIWPGRSRAEVCEAARLEALVEDALAGVSGIMVCPYSATGLPGSVLADAACTHPWQAGPDAVVPSARYAGPGAVPAACRLPLPAPPSEAEVIEYESDLRPVRAMVAAAGQRAGLPASRVTDLTIAVSELAANTLRHTGAGGVAQAWQAAGEMICQVADSGYIADPLAGLSRVPADLPGGKGLWLVNQVCDLVEIRTTEAGTVIRLHMRLPPAAGAPARHVCVESRDATGFDVWQPDAG